MSVPRGYAGKVAFIDLTKPEVKVVPTDRFFKDYNIDPRLWLGGDGFIAKVLWKDITKAIDPLSPENEIVIAGGPWTGTAAPQAGTGNAGLRQSGNNRFFLRFFRLVFPGDAEICRIRCFSDSRQGCQADLRLYR